MDLYKGYIRTRGKRAAEAFKGVTAFKSYENVKDLDEFAGVLADDTVLIDIDDKKQAELLMTLVETLELKCKVYETTRGMHFLFKNDLIKKCSTHSNLAIGLTADIKVGSKPTYEVLKFDARERLTIYDNQPYQNVPKWLIPVKKGRNFTNLEEGDGRNQAFYNYILTLQSNGFGQEEIRECIKLINTYIVKEPLPNSELDVILRDEAFQMQSFFSGNTFKFDVFATFLKNTYHIIRINGQLHYYKDGIYKKGQLGLEGLIIKHIPNLNQAKRREVLAYLEVLEQDNVTIAPANLIAFRNGILDIKTMTMKEFSPNIVMVNKIDWDYNPNAKSEIVDHVLNKISCNDASIRANLEETAGYCLFRRNELGKAVMLTGDGSNGKSTYLTMVQTMLGDDNTSSLDLRKISDRFSTVMLYQKLANIGDDISGEYIPDTADFRKVVTGDKVAAEQKGQPKFDFKPYCKLIFSSNNIPRLGKGRDFTAIKRRLQIIPFNAKFSKADPDYIPYIIDKLTEQEAIEYLIVLAIEGLKRILENKSFTTSKVGEEELATYESIVDPMKGFLEDHEKSDFVNQSTNDVYRMYELYCIDNKLTAMGQRMFIKQLCKKMNLKSKQQRAAGKRIQVLNYE